MNYFKNKDKVSFHGKDGTFYTGRVVRRVQKANGEWMEINVAEPRQPALLRYVRESQLQPA